MRYSELIGQREAVGRLMRQVEADRLPHALLLTGPEGAGKFALALSFASYLLCEHPTDGDSCGTCPGCVKTSRLEHPDLHFIFPTIRKQTCKSLYRKWEDMVTRTPYFNLDTWLAEMGADREQAVIYAQESDAIQDALHLHSTEGGRKVVIIWLPERMNEVTANKMLKLLEEPPEGTVFLLVSEAPEMLLPTVISRTQRFAVPPIAEGDMREALISRHGLDADTAARLSHEVRGSYTEALAILQSNDDEQQFFDQFVLLMRQAWARDIRGMMEQSRVMRGWGREKLRNFITYCLRLVRENFVYNFRIPSLTYMRQKEEKFATRFARFINERNVIPIARSMQRLGDDIAQNANAEIAFFDFSMKMIILIHR